MRKNNVSFKPLVKKGFSLMEIMVVSVVIAVMAASLLPRFFEQQKSGEAKDEFAKLTELRNRIVTLYDGDFDYDGVEDAWKDQLPRSYSTNGTTVVSVWKNPVTVAESGSNGFEINYEKVPKGIACTEFAKLGREAGWTEVVIGSTSFNAESKTADIASQCKSAANTDVIDFKFVHETL
ncbi:type 4 pilus major pilin [Vibrio coralliirubri]|uniref:type 4 pilus major pilin n=1 Tax=Vibrio coralliirubri TaxID=1516159 RepID=UPI002283C67D|nr:type 4 pilus major pilin [Vibrio coralliirubri]MCY9866128.1 type 4 pilus major pilin [Vibrio coralliirubri]